MKPKTPERPPIDVSKLYDSERCQLFGIVTTGKKETSGVLQFKGLPSILGNGTEVRAIMDGIVTYTGRCYDPHSRKSRRGRVVSIRGNDGVTISYERLYTTANISEGDLIRAGDPVGIEGDTGTGKGVYLQIRFDRNGRLVDGCEYLNIPREVGEFRGTALNAEDAVCQICHLDSKERYGIRTLPNADVIWRKILRAFESKSALQVREG